MNILNENFDKHFKKIFTEFINLYGKNGERYKNYKNKPYVVFDFDDTISCYDSQNAVALYQILNKKFKQIPDEFEKTLNKIIDKKYLNINLGEKYDNKTLKELMDDVIYLYNLIFYNNETDEEYNEFCIKMLHFIGILLSFGDYELDTNISFLGFVDFTKEESKNLCKEALKFYENKNFNINLYNNKIQNSKLNIKNLSINLVDEFFIPEETKLLLKTLYENGFDIYVCSASFYDVLDVIVNEMDFGLNYIKKVFGLKANIQNNKYTLEKMPNSVITRRYGKSDCIEKFLIKEYGYGPVLVAGDTMGDFTMLTEFKDTAVSILFNKSKNDDTKYIVHAANIQKNNNYSLKEVNDNNDTYFILQGKNFNTGKYISCTNSINYSKNDINKDISITPNTQNISEIINLSKEVNFKGYKTK